MLPSKDNDALRVDYSPNNSPVDEREEPFRGDDESETLSWKKQALADVRPSRHRDT